VQPQTTVDIWEKRFMPAIRAFIAVDLPPELRERLASVAEDLKAQMSSVPVRWVPPENMHLTLKFLGDVSLANLDVLKDILQGEAADRDVMAVSLGELGAFPKMRRPRVIWVGMAAPPTTAYFIRPPKAESIV
jgi:2'-5' RNA ligase